jgi:lipoprotein-releasing system ATP-binding protein
MWAHWTSAGGPPSATNTWASCLFRRIHREMGTTFVIVTHDRAIAQHTDRIFEVRDGGVYQDVRNDYAPPGA